MTQPDPQLALDAFPLTATQENALALTAPKATPLALWELRGAVQDHDIEAALHRVIERHEILRTRFVRQDGAWRQEVLPAIPLKLGHVDIRALPIDDHADRVDAIAAELAAAPFDLQAPPLIRASLVRTAPRRAALLVAFHRAVMDARSAELVGQEIWALLVGGAGGSGAKLPRLALQYGDYALWERDCRDSGAAARDRDWWLNRLSGLRPAHLAADRGNSTGGEARVVVPLPPRFQARVDAACCALDVSPHALGAAASSAALARVADCAGRESSDIVLATEADGRCAPELAPLAGAFGRDGLLPLRVGPQTDLATHLGATARALADADAHGACPLDDILAAFDDAQGPGALPAATARFTLQSLRPSGQEGTPLSLSAPVLDAPASGGGLALHLILSPQSSTLTVSGKGCGLSSERMAALAEAFLAAIDALVEGRAACIADLPGPAPATPPAARPAPSPARACATETPQDPPRTETRPTWEVVLLRDGPDAGPETGPDAGPVVVSINQPFLYRNFAACFAEDRIVVNLMVPDRASLDLQRERGYPAALDEATAILGQRFGRRPLVLMGQCIDGMTALHIARSLEERGGNVAFVAMIDAWAPMYPGTGGPTSLHRLQSWDQSRRRWQHYLGLAAHRRLGLRDLMLRSGAGRRLLRRLGQAPDDTAGADLIVAVNRHHTEVGHRTPFAGWDGEVITFASDSQPARAFRTLFGWRGLLPADTPIHRVPGWHEDALLHRSYARIAEVIDTRLTRHLRRAPT